MELNTLEETEREYLKSKLGVFFDKHENIKLQGYFYSISVPQSDGVKVDKKMNKQDLFNRFLLDVGIDYDFWATFLPTFNIKV